MTRPSRTRTGASNLLSVRQYNAKYKVFIRILL